MESSTRSMTATTGRTVLAIVAILSLLLSAFAIARPVIASHEPPNGPEVEPTPEEFGGGNPVCPAGSVGYRFNNPEAEDWADVILADGSTATVTILSVDDNQLIFEVEGGLAAIVTVKGGVSSPGTPDQNVYDYREEAGGGIAHDDGLTTPNEQGISHVDFCLVPVEASILVYKTDQTGADVAGAEFTVYDGETVVAGPAATDASGFVCFDDLVLDKDYTVTETAAPDGYIGDPDSQTVAASLGNCEDRIADDDAADATFTNTLLGAIVIYKTDQTGADVADAIFTVEGKEGTFTTGADGTFCVDGLAVGDTVTVTETDAPDGYELANPASQEVTVTQAGDCEDHDGTPDATFTNNLLGSLLVLKTDDSDDPLEDADFSITGPGPFSATATSDADGWFCIDGLTFGAEYTVTETDAPDGYQMDANPQTHVIDDSAACAERGANEPVADLVFVNVEDEDLGSITINKSVECEVCQTFTPGYYFNNQSQTPGYQDATRLLEANSGIEIGGWTFDDVQDVVDQAAPGSLLRHTLALQLNVWLAEESDCDLASQVFASEGNDYDGWTVGEILAEALEILESGDPALAESGNAGYADLHEAIDLINNNHGADDGVLSCEGTSTGAGYDFALFDDEENEVGTGTTDESGTLMFSDLPLGTYTLVETGGPGENCSIVSATGDGVSFDPETGVITITLTAENADVTVAVVNECEAEEEGELGSITIIKNAAPDAAQDFAFTTTGTGLSSFSLDDDADATLSNQRTFDDLAPGSYSVTESATSDWTLTSITCSAGGSVDLAGRKATITISGSENVTCTFVNTRQGEGTQGGGQPGGGRGVTPREGTLAGNPLPNTATTPASGGSLPAVVLALIALGALAVGGQRAAAEVRSRR